MKKVLAGFVGFAVGLLLFAVGREAWFAFASRPAAQVLGELSRYLGRQWLYDYQTLIAGAAALYAARWSVRAIENQIDRSDLATKRQLAQVERIEMDRRDAKRSAVRAVLPLTLSILSQHSEDRATKLRGLLAQCERGALPKTAAVPAFAAPVADAISTLKEMIEFGLPHERAFISRLLVAIQIQSSRLSSLQMQHKREGFIVFEGNIEAYILGEAEIYARANAIYSFARGVSNDIPQWVSKKQIASALFNLGIFDEAYNKLEESYDLTSDEIWEPIRDYRQ